MNKRYQVFVSSTYADLKDERQRVTQTLMEMDCIPAGMELFPALDQEQWEFIKRVIDDCDYYILIIGGRYGTLTADGISYTEKEYDYAISAGLKVLAFVHKNPDTIPVEKSDIDPTLRENLNAFRDKVTAERLVKFWTTAAELPGIVALSLQKTIKLYPAIGWVRANQIASDDLLADMNEIRKTNDNLVAKVKQLEVQEPPQALNLAGLDELFEFKIRWTTSTDGFVRRQETIKTTWSNIFASIGPSLVAHPIDGKASNIIAAVLYRQIYHSTYEPNNIQVAIDDFDTIRIQLTTLGLVETKYTNTTKGLMGLFWRITPKGQQLLLQLRAVKSSHSNA